jgi:hypothetical protein
MSLRPDTAQQEEMLAMLIPRIPDGAHTVM